MGLSLIGVARSQHTGQPAFRYLLHVLPVSADQSPKPLFAAINGLLPESMFSLDDEKRSLWLDTHRAVGLGELQAATGNTGFTVLALERYHRLTGERLSLEGEGTAPQPVFLDTGNEAADHARYDAAKAAWIEADPAAYQRLNDPNTHREIQGTDEK